MAVARSGDCAVVIVCRGMKPAPADFDHNHASFYSAPAAGFDAIRSSEPVLYSRNYGGYWILTRYKDVHSALLDWKRFSSVGQDVTSVQENWPRGRSVVELPVGSDPPDHTRYRALVSPWFARRRLETLEAPLRSLAGRLIWLAADRGECDVVQDFAIPYVLEALAHFLGVPIDDVPRWHRWAKGIFMGRTAAMAESDAARAELLSYVDEAVERAHREPGEDFFTLLVRAQIDGRPLAHDELVGFASLAFLAGLETTVNAIATSFRRLAAQPDLLRQVREDRRHIPTAIEEFLRISSPVQLLGRRAAVDVVLGGQLIGKGDLVAVCYGAANMDPEAFERAAECVLNRTPNRHIAFGAGRHSCLGASLARLEIRIALEEALATWSSWELDDADREVILPRGDLHGYWKLPLRLSV